MSTNVWMKQKWIDRNLRWVPGEYGNITSIRIPSEWLWLPDVVMMENTDGNFTASHMTSAHVRHDGLVAWQPPASLKSWCYIDVTYFPFDVQNCTMKFASWTYGNNTVQLVPMETKVDVTNLLHNGEWDIVDTHVEHTSSSDPSLNMERNTIETIEVMFGQNGISYCFVMKRLPLFYIVFLITPCLGISFLTALVFYLPSDSQEKITLCISVLLAHTFYLLVITEIIPSTSNAIPLIGEYLLFTMIFITLSIIVTTTVINVHYRSNTTHRPLPKHLRYVLLTVAPSILCLRKFSSRIQWNLPLINLSASILQRRLQECEDVTTSPSSRPYPNPEVITAYQCVRFLVRRIKKKVRHRREKEEWMYAAMVMDRIFLAVFLFVSFVGTIVLFLPALAKYHEHSGSREEMENH
ncbi:neuronal acetylcholine receptor subunit non-alpha-3-like isoform X1 [Ciona intestinalis]